MPQLRFRLGGPQTVRGYVYGVAVGRSFWSAQGDVELTVSQWWSPTLFADVGNVDFADTPLVGVGAGVSFLSGWVKLQIARGVTGSGVTRFDVLVQLPGS
jgi:hemolysin activation/secretion protein